MADAQPEPQEWRQFVHRTLATLALVAVGVTLFVWTWYAVHVLLIGFAGVLLAILLRSLADFVGRWTRLSPGWSLAVVVVALFGGLVGLGWLLVPSISRQVDEIAKRVPEQLDDLEQELGKYSWGRALIGHAPTIVKVIGADEQPATQPATPPGGDGAGDGGGGETGAATRPATGPTTRPEEGLERVAAAAAQPVVRQARVWVTSFFTGIVGLVVVTAVGIYLAVSPRSYVEGVLHLLPMARRDRVRQTFHAMGHALRWWLVGQGFTMLVIGVLTGVGLKLIGVKLWLTFAVLAALFNFVPNFGPLVSYIPAVLFALADQNGAHKAIWVTALYLVAQCFEGYVLTPMVQKKAVDTPPALLILSQVLMGVLVGTLGVVLAAPLLTAAIVAVKMLYVRDTLGDASIEEPAVGAAVPNDEIRMTNDESNPNVRMTK